MGIFAHYTVNTLFNCFHFIASGIQSSSDELIHMEEYGSNTQSKFGTQMQFKSCYLLLSHLFLNDKEIKDFHYKLVVDEE